MTDGDDLTVRESHRTAADWEHVLAGHLVGTDWTVPTFDEDVSRVSEVRRATERAEGGRAEYPEVVFGNGRHFAVSGFLRRIDPDDVGDVEPADDAAERIVEIQETVSWRSVELRDGSRTREEAGTTDEEPERGGDGGGVRR